MLKKVLEINPPINPSQVFFGDSSMSFLFPKKNPKIYAKISLLITKMQGVINQISP